MNAGKMISGIPIKGIHAAGAVLVLGMLAGSGSFLFLRTQEAADRARVAQMEYQASVQELETKTAISTTLRDDIEMLQHRMEELPELEGPGAYNQRSAVIASTAERVGIRIDLLQPDPQQTQGRVSWIPIQCTGQGTMAAFMQWIELLEESWPDIVVQSLSVDADETGEQLGLRVVFRWYVLGEKAG